MINRNNDNWTYKAIHQQIMVQIQASYLCGKRSDQVSLTDREHILLQEVEYLSIPRKQNTSSVRLWWFILDYQTRPAWPSTESQDPPHARNVLSVPSHAYASQMLLQA